MRWCWYYLLYLESAHYKLMKAKSFICLGSKSGLYARRSPQTKYKPRQNYIIIYLTLLRGNIFNTFSDGTRKTHAHHRLTKYIYLLCLNAVIIVISRNVCVCVRSTHIHPHSQLYIPARKTFEYTHLYITYTN